MVDAGPLGEVDSVNLYAFNRFDSVNFIDPFGLDAEGSADGHSKDGRDPNDPKLDGGAEFDISVRAGGVDDDFIADMECKYLNKCTTGNLERLEQKGGWRQPSDVPSESPSNNPQRGSGGRVASRASLVYASILDILLVQVPGAQAGSASAKSRLLKREEIADEEFPLIWSRLNTEQGVDDETAARDAIRRGVKASKKLRRAIALLVEVGVKIRFQLGGKKIDDALVERGALADINLREPDRNSEHGKVFHSRIRTNTGDWESLTASPTGVYSNVGGGEKRSGLSVSYGAVIWHEIGHLIGQLEGGAGSPEIDSKAVEFEREMRKVDGLPQLPVDAVHPKDY